MIIALVLLYVGAVLVVNGIWLLGHIADREVGVLNTFAGGIGLISAITVAVVGTIEGNLASIELAAYILLFAFTYLWVAINQYLDVDGRGLGWYCLFVAITAVPTAWLTFTAADGQPWLTWLAVNWAVWAVLWFLYFLLLAQRLAITRLAAAVTLLAGVGTAWLPAYLLLNELLPLPAA
ncbi:AmiS/UreI family transporter [Haloechinothrix sp. LS1_15]|uniref:AmiS/UreI family transporter n=1 Tax=Haloechinothrix sp. LS1_15 TaxID=2652248 RepID=UPI002943FF85|nr:AmiS/UreI family transporter [Haloechinothrix sp. LS1_15]MDV6012425.1 transporter [Haloechinothrix sp. LS1_15]